jgi:hypothetical protein
MSENAVSNLLRQIYHQPPWSINQNLSNTDISAVSRSIVSASGDDESINYDLAPGMIFEIDIDNDARNELSHFRLPAATTITGIRDWHELFGKRSDTGAWLWVDLASNWEHARVYEFLFAKMFQDAISREQPRGVLLRSVASGELYRVTLRRFETFSNRTKHRFHLTAAALNLPFDLPSDLSEKKETVLYHLVNLTWYFRRRFVDNLYDQLLGLSSMRDAGPASG